MIPFVNLAQVNKPYQTEIENSIRRVVLGGQFIGGKEVNAFEEEFASYTGAGQCISCGSGTDGLLLALKAFEFKNGSEVILAGNSFIAAALAVLKSQLEPIAIEINPDTFLVEAQEIEKHIGPKTKAVLITHMYGAMCQMPEIRRLCQQHGLALIEDCSHAHGLKLNGKHVGTWGDAGIFSFYPTKNLGALGDAGAIITSSTRLSQKIRLLKQYGTLKKRQKRSFGMNSRMDALQAAILRVKINTLESENLIRTELAGKYIQGINNPQIVTPITQKNHVWHLFVVKCQKRDELRNYLLEKGVETKVHYPIPFYRETKGVIPQLPINERVHEQVLSLPLNSGLKPLEQEFIIQALNLF